MLEQLKTTVAFLRHFIRRYSEDDCMRSAAALTYMSLFAVVPLMTVAYTMFSLIPSFAEMGDKIQALIFSNFLPAAGDQVQGYLVEFSGQARTLTAFGIGFLALTAFLMLKNIEQTLNSIWKTRANRQGLSSFLLYWAVLSLGPLFIGIGFLISTYLISLTVIFDGEYNLGISELLLRQIPLALQILGFSLLFGVVPNAKVPLRHALAGGTAAALVFELAKKSFAAIVSNSSYQLIYGAFAAVPLFLLWIYLSWLIILGGAVFTQSLAGFSNRASRVFDPLIIAVALLELFYRRHQTGKQVTERDILSDRWLLDKYPLTAHQWQQLRDILIDAKIICATDNDTYILSRDLNRLSIWQLSLLLPGIESTEQTRPGSNEQYPWYDDLRGLLIDVDRYSRDKMDISLADLFQQKEDKGDAGE
ncbi:MAG: YihY family inner membrane protein [Pseudomonadales bacterium]